MSTGRPHQILVRTGWQDCNIGDVAHAPGALAVIERMMPDVRAVLWSFTPLTAPLRRMILARFPQATIVEGTLCDGAPSTPELSEAFEESDLFLHASGPATIAWADAVAFHQRTGKPFGVYGVTYGLYGIPERSALSEAAFVYFRDSKSLARAKADGVRPPVIGFSPDVAFAFDVRDDHKADAYLARVGLESGRFLCCIPRMRCTPFWEIPRKGAAFDPLKDERNTQTKTADHAGLLSSIITVVRETDLRVLVCPEDETQITLAKEMLIDRLPDDVRSRVVWRNTYWQPDEALAVYVRSAGLFGNEMHSPILCIGNGVPAIVCHSRDVSTKGYMWQDVGLGDWLFDLDEQDVHTRIVAAVMSIATDPAGAKAKAAAARETVWRNIEASAGVVLNNLTRSRAMQASTSMPAGARNA